MPESGSISEQSSCKIPILSRTMRSRSSRSVPTSEERAVRQTEPLGNEALWHRLPGAGRDAPKEHPASLNNVNPLPKLRAAVKPLAAVPIGEADGQDNHCGVSQGWTSPTDGCCGVTLDV